ncbi:hypothetical protein STEG23_035318, partial [Scotinomys teguina]
WVIRTAQSQVLIHPPNKCLWEQGSCALETGKWKELENIILSEVTQTQKDKHDIQEFYEVTLLNSHKSCEQKIEEANQVAQKWEKTLIRGDPCRDGLQKSGE